MPNLEITIDLDEQELRAIIQLEVDDIRNSQSNLQHRFYLMFVDIVKNFSSVQRNLLADAIHSAELSMNWSPDWIRQPTIDYSPPETLYHLASTLYYTILTGAVNNTNSPSGVTKIVFVSVESLVEQVTTKAYPPSVAYTHQDYLKEYPATVQKG